MNSIPGVSPPRPDEPRARFLVELARALGTYGTSSNRLEEVIAVSADDLGLSAQTFNTPTSVFVSVESELGLTTYLARVTPGETDLTKLMAIDRVFNVVTDHHLSPEEGISEIKRIVKMAPLYPAWMLVLAFGVVSASAGHFLGGGLKEMGASGLIGLVVGVLVQFTGRRREFSRLMEFLSGLSAALIAGLLVVPFGGYMAAVAAIAGIIILLPGLTLTIAMVELATKHVVSGTARLAGAAMVLMVIGFGVVIGQGLVDRIVGERAVVLADPMAWWVDLVSVIVASACMAVLFQAHLRHVWVMVTAGLLSFYSARYGTAYLGPEAGVLGASMAVGVASNLYARVFDRPALTMMLPGLLMLVPGSLGLRSLQLFLSNDTVTGVQSTFTVLVVGVALVVGLLLANVILPPRKVL
jgi:uncharacterized membrane protein YjjP (DUF1212 family)